MDRQLIIDTPQALAARENSISVSHSHNSRAIGGSVCQKLRADGLKGSNYGVQSKSDRRPGHPQWGPWRYAAGR
jgi:hypothetical protein